MARKWGGSIGMLSMQHASPQNIFVDNRVGRVTVLNTRTRYASFVWHTDNITTLFTSVQQDIDVIETCYFV